MSRRKSDADQLRDLLLWARKERIVLRDITIGTVGVTIERDHKMDLPSGAVAVPERKLSLVEQMAGPLLQKLQGEGVPDVNEPTVEDDDA